MTQQARLQASLDRARAALARGDMAAFAQALGEARANAADPAQALQFEIDRAWALGDLGERAAALTLARAADIEADPRQAAKLGALFDRLESPEEALPLFRRAAELTPGRPEPWLDLAIVSRSVGDLDQAEAACERALSLAPSASEAHALLASLRRWSDGRNHVERLTRAAAGARPGIDTARLGYALFKELDDLGRHEDAWTALEAAAGEARRVMPWSTDRDRALVEAVRSAFPAGPSRTGEPGAPRPIFVVGLPRSGTSLVERILVAHSQVAPLGELGAFGGLVHQALGVQSTTYLDAPAAARLGEVDWPAIGRAYRQIVGKLAPGAAATVDKLPQNWLFAGAIAQALPDAVILHLNRAPMDSLFGAYRQLFARDFAWSYSQDDLAAHYAHYRLLTGHWTSTLGAAWVDIDYEALARNPDAKVPDLLAGARLEFEPGCLTPHLGEGRARSISTLQLREPINTRGIGAWRAYEAKLQPLCGRLEALGFGDPT